MDYEQLLIEIQNPENKVFKKVLRMMGGLENVKYSLRDSRKVLFYALGSDVGIFAPEWVMKAVFVGGQKQSYSSEQIVAVFDALHNRYKEDQKQAMVLHHSQRLRE
ncbi:MAG: hypothetical protein IJL05_03190 [Alphaproteobacteria bacterium]|nr:hypothetical protein [Alphaproteobacteria bacterium]